MPSSATDTRVPGVPVVDVLRRKVPAPDEDVLLAGCVPIVTADATSATTASSLSSPDVPAAACTNANTLPCDVLHQIHQFGRSRYCHQPGPQIPRDLFSAISSRLCLRKSRSRERESPPLTTNSATALGAVLRRTLDRPACCKMPA